MPEKGGSGKFQFGDGSVTSTPSKVVGALDCGRNSTQLQTIWKLRENTDVVAVLLYFLIACLNELNLLQKADRADIMWMYFVCVNTGL